MTSVAGAGVETVRYCVTGMDCPSCAGKIERAALGVAGVEDVKVSITSQVLTLTVDNVDARLPEVERGITGLGYQLDRLHASHSPGELDELPRNLSHITPAYKRALWAVVVLNLGYGLIEIGGGFLAGSQALKADALDFLGDGLITLLGLAAIGWKLGWRARAALIQGLFLGALGISVLAAAAYRVFILNEPHAGLMGALGAMALVVNISAAAVLIPHRAGDANVRAVWLFSRNDAIGNLAVVAAAGLVFWTGNPWPDLVVAALIASLFLHSSWSIVKDASSDLRANGQSEYPLSQSSTRR